jgi:hypothetical protein
VVVCLLLASVLTWISANLSPRFDHRAEAIQNQNTILAGKAATDYVVDGEVRGANNSPYYYGMLQARVFFPALLVGTTEALGGRLSESQVYLLLNCTFAFLGLLTFCVIALSFGLTLSQMLMAMLGVSIQRIVGFKEGWEHPTDFPDLAFTALMLLCVFNKQRLALITVIVIMSFNLESGVFASVIWFFMYAVSKWRVSWTELSFSALLGFLAIALNTALRFAFGGPTALLYTRVQELQHAPATILSSITRFGPNPFWAWPVFLAAAFVIPGVWMFEHRQHADEKVKRLLLASVVIGAVVSVTGILSELRDWSTSMTTFTFAGVYLAALAAQHATGALERTSDTRQERFAGGALEEPLAVGASHGDVAGQGRAGSALRLSPDH